MQPKHYSNKYIFLLSHSFFSSSKLKHQQPTGVICEYDGAKYKI